MWHEDLRGSSLLILTDSTAALENVKAGVSADQQSRDIVAHIQFFAMIYRIHLWFDWVPSKQNPGDPFSRPSTCGKEAEELDKQLGATRFEPVWPSFLRASPTAWRTVVKSPTAPATWTISKQIHALVELGVARPEEFGIALLHLVNPDKAIVLRMGHWPRSRPCGKHPQTTFSLQLTKLLLCVAAAYAPQKVITAILVEQRAKTMHKVESPVCALRIGPGALTIAVKQDGCWYNIVKCPLTNEHRHMTVFLGTNQEVLRAKQRMQLKRSGFSLRFLD